MKEDKLWARFEKSGKVTDYLQYCGIDLTESVATDSVAEPPAREEHYESDDRRAHHSDKR